MPLQPLRPRPRAPLDMQFTPGRKTSHNVSSSDHTPTAIPQNELKETLGYELENHTWQFGAERFANFLSRKIPKTEEPLGNDRDSLDRYHIDVQQPNFKEALRNAWQTFKKRRKDIQWPKTNAESGFYALLSACVSSCNAALDSIEYRAERLYSTLHFVPYDKPMKDGVDGANSLKPDGAGVLDEFDITTERLYWSSLDGKILAVPVEVKADWKALVRQAASYARCLFGAHPLRQHALVIGFRQVPPELGTGKELRFLLFHRGGLSASKAFNVETEDGCRDILRVFLAFLTWETLSDSGIPPWCNNAEFCLPRDPSDPKGDSLLTVTAEIDSVLYQNVCARGRAVRVCEVTYPLSTRQIQASPPSPPEIQPRRSTRLASRSLQPSTPGTTSQTEKTPLLLSPLRGIKTQLKRVSAAVGRSRPHLKPNASRAGGSLQAGTSGEESVADIKNSPPSTSWPWNTPTVNSSPLHSDPNSVEYARAVVKSSWIRDEHKTIEAELLHACRTDFGTAMHHYSFDGCLESGQIMNNHLFLPTEDEIPEAYWPLFSKTAPTSPEYRTLVSHILWPAGQSLIHARTPWILMLSIAHSMLGWLFMCLRGFQHRDISIGNILLLDPSDDDEKPEDDLETLLAALSLGSSALEENLAEVKGYLTKLSNGKVDCFGMVIDGDMAIKWETYFCSSHDGSKSGTREYMSDDLREAYDTARNYLQTPVDDLFSFYYVGQWAAVFNSLSGNRSDFLIRAQEDLVIERAKLLNRILLVDEESMSTAPFLASCQPILAKWCQSLTALKNQWASGLKKSPPPTDNATAMHDYYVPRFCQIATQGVVEYYKLLLDHRAELERYSSPDALWLAYDSN